MRRRTRIESRWLGRKDDSRWNVAGECSFPFRELAGRPWRSEARIVEILAKARDVLDRLAGLGRMGWKRLDGVYTWSGHGWGARPVPESLAYHSFNRELLVEALAGRPFRRSLEIGCGFGAETPWIAEHSREAHAIDPNSEVLDEARRWYRSVKFRVARAQDLPYPDSHFDLVVSWTVLQHIPPEEIGAVSLEIKRVLADDGVLLLFESMKNKRSRPPVWYRSRAWYEELLLPLALVRRIPRESVSGQAEAMELLRFDA